MLGRYMLIFSQIGKGNYGVSRTTPAKEKVIYGKAYKSAYA
jgi:hypothetical protein